MRTIYLIASLISLLPLMACVGAGPKLEKPATIAMTAAPLPQAAERPHEIPLAEVSPKAPLLHEVAEEVTPPEPESEATEQVAKTPVQNEQHIATEEEARQVEEPACQKLLSTGILSEYIPEDWNVEFKSPTSENEFDISCGEWTFGAKAMFTLTRTRDWGGPGLHEGNLYVIYDHNFDSFVGKTTVEASFEYDALALTGPHAGLTSLDDDVLHMYVELQRPFSLTEAEVGSEEGITLTPYIRASLYQPVGWVEGAQMARVGARLSVPLSEDWKVDADVCYIHDWNAPKNGNLSDHDRELLAVTYGQETTVTLEGIHAGYDSQVALRLTYNF